MPLVNGNRRYGRAVLHSEEEAKSSSETVDSLSVDAASCPKDLNFYNTHSFGAHPASC
jgi:hypothetical protein